MKNRRTQEHASSIALSDSTNKDNLVSNLTFLFIIKGRKMKYRRELKVKMFRNKFD